MTWFRCSGGGSSSGGGYEDIFIGVPIIANTYIDESGQEIPYGGWSSTDFIAIPDGADYIYRNGSISSSNYNAFYTNSKTFISFFGSASKDGVPTNAKYVRYSGATWTTSGKLFAASGGGGGVASDYERLCYTEYVMHDATEIPVISSIDTGADYANYLSYDSTTKKFTVLQSFSAVVTAWVMNESSSSYPPQGAFYKNDTQIMSFAASNSQGSKGGKTLPIDFVSGDTFYSYTPKEYGWPKQFLKVYRFTDNHFADMTAFDDENA